MRGIMAAICTVLTMIVAGYSPMAAAQDNLVVVELYTSQGCSSCPPADALVAELAGQEDVIALALHVDYWDYIGWKDSFANPAFTERQRSYARAAGHSTIYTPQMIVQGRDHIIGYKPMQLASLIQTHKENGAAVDVSLVRSGNSLSITAPALPRRTKDMVVQLVRYTPSETVAIRRGENAGKTITYSNIVREWRVLGKWNGARPLQMSAEVKGDDPVVVILQMERNGPIMAAARLR